MIRYLNSSTPAFDKQLITSTEIADSAVTSAKILDNTVVNADINSAAAITYAKLTLANSIVNTDFSNAAGQGNGTWATYTPTLYSGGVAATLGTGGTADGFYTRIGRWILTLMSIKLGTAGSALTAGNFLVTLPTTPDMPAATLLLFGEARVTGLGTTGAPQALALHQPIGAASTANVVWRFANITSLANGPVGVDTVWSTTAPLAPVINQAANNLRIDCFVMYLSTT